MVSRVMCVCCGELLYDPYEREHFLEEDMDGINHCPGCGTVYHLLTIVKRGDAPDIIEEVSI